MSYVEGNVPWNKGKKCPQISKSRKGSIPWNTGKHWPKKWRDKMSKTRIEGIKTGKIKTWNKGKVGIYSEEALKKMRVGFKGRKHTKESKEKISIRGKGRKHTKEAKIKIGIAHKGKKYSEETKLKISLTNRGKYPTKETKRKISEARKGKCVGKNNPMYGKSFTEEHRRKLSETGKGHIPWNTGEKTPEETRKKISLANKGRISPLRGRKLSEEHKRKVSQALKGKKRSKETCQKMSRIVKQLWKNKEHAKKMMAAFNVTPNKLEMSFQHFVNVLLPNEYKFVGDGHFILGGKCPDFMNINGQKKLIELWGDYWHKGQNPQERIDYFKQYGFDTLVIWEKEFKKNIVMVKDKVLTFNKAA